MLKEKKNVIKENFYYSPSSFWLVYCYLTLSYLTLKRERVECLVLPACHHNPGTDKAYRQSHIRPAASSWNQRQCSLWKFDADVAAAMVVMISVSICHCIRMKASNEKARYMCEDSVFTVMPAVLDRFVTAPLLLAKHIVPGDSNVAVLFASCVDGFQLMCGSLLSGVDIQTWRILYNKIPASIHTHTDMSPPCLTNFMPESLAVTKKVCNKSTAYDVAKHKSTAYDVAKHKSTAYYKAKHKSTAYCAAKHKSTAYYVAKHKCTAYYAAKHKMYSILCGQAQMYSILCNQAQQYSILCSM